MNVDSSTTDAPFADRVILDVRTPAEFETAHIPGAINVPLALVQRHAAQLVGSVPTDAVVVCRSGGRAQSAVTALAHAGLVGPEVLAGGMQAWSQAARPIARGVARWDLERQVRLVAGSLVLSGVLASTVVPRAKWFAGAIGAGLTFAAVSNTCVMGTVLSTLPYNQASSPTLASVLGQLDR